MNIVFDELMGCEPHSRLPKLDYGVWKNGLTGVDI